MSWEDIIKNEDRKMMSIRKRKQEYREFVDNGGNMPFFFVG